MSWKVGDLVFVNMWSTGEIECGRIAEAVLMNDGSWRYGIQFPMGSYAADQTQFIDAWQTHYGLVVKNE